MAITNLFKLFGENAASGRVHTDNDWNNNNERKSGFLTGQPASSVNVNTAIKSNSLVTMALVEAIKSTGNGSVGLSTSVSDMANIFDTALQKLAKNAVKGSLTFTKIAGTAGSTGDTLKITIDGTEVQQTVVNTVNAATATKATYDSSGSKAIRSYIASLEVSNSTITAKDADGNQVSQITITNPTSADSAAKDGAGNVITSTYGASLGGNNTNTVKLISKSGAEIASIVVNNVVNATNATNATNVVITTDSSSGNDVVAFSIGTGMYSKTINDVAHALNADNATNATNATNVTITKDATVADNVIKFSIGNATYNKTVSVSYLNVGTVGAANQIVYFDDGNPTAGNVVKTIKHYSSTVSGFFRQNGSDVNNKKFTKPSDLTRVSQIVGISFVITVWTKDEASSTLQYHCDRLLHLTGSGTTFGTSYEGSSISSTYDCYGFAYDMITFDLSALTITSSSTYRIFETIQGNSKTRTQTPYFYNLADLKIFYEV